MYICKPLWLIMCAVVPGSVQDILSGSIFCYNRIISIQANNAELPNFLFKLIFKAKKNLPDPVKGLIGGIPVTPLSCFKEYLTHPHSRIGVVL